LPIFVIRVDGYRDFKFGRYVDHSKSQLTVTNYTQERGVVMVILGPHRTNETIGSSNLLCGLTLTSTSVCMMDYTLKGIFHGHVTSLLFGK